MMRALFSAAATTHHLKHHDAFLAVPDFTLSSDVALSYMDPLFLRAGLSGFRTRRWDAARAALLGLYQLQHCYEIDVNMTHQIPDLECEKYNGRPTHTFLSIQLDSDYFGLRQMYRDDGLIAASKNLTEVHFDHGTGSMAKGRNSSDYWKWIKSRVAPFSQYEGGPIDLLILHGTQVRRPEFLDLIREIFAGNDKIKEEDYLRSAEEHWYAASRGVAQLAKVGMWSNFVWCIPMYGCPESEQTPRELRWDAPMREPSAEDREEL